MPFTIGTDPEFVLTDPYGAVLSAIDKVGTKEDPTQFPLSGATMFSDNVLLEINIKPAFSMAGFLTNIRKALLDATTALGSEYRILTTAALQFPEKETRHPKAFMFGCEPEFCVWKDAEGDSIAGYVPPPMIRPGNNFRSCGGHIHIGHEVAINHRVELVKALDMFASIPMILMDPDATSGDRRAIYGGAGYFRPTKYGLEYRTPSNFWLAAPEYVAVVYRLVGLAIQNYDWEISPEVKDTINDHSKAQALAWWDEFVKPSMDLKRNAFLIQAIEKLASEMQKKDLYHSWELPIVGVEATV